MRAKDVLLDSLSKYSGTVVFVSHDRYFIDNLADRIFEIEEGHVHVYPGITRIICGGGGRPEQIQAVTAAVREPEPEPVAVAADSKKRVNPMKLQKLQAKLARVEKEVASLEWRSRSMMRRWRILRAWKRRSGCRRLWRSGQAVRGESRGVGEGLGGVGRGGLTVSLISLGRLG